MIPSVDQLHIIAWRCPRCYWLNPSPSPSPSNTDACWCCSKEHSGTEYYVGSDDYEIMKQKKWKEYARRWGIHTEEQIENTLKLWHAECLLG